jgi:hypothetical protein
MSGMSKAGCASGHFNLGISWDPCDYTVSVKAIDAKVLELSFSALPGTERRTEDDRQAFVKQLVSKMEGEHQPAP